MSLPTNEWRCSDLNINYLQALDKLSFAKSDIEKLWDEGQKATNKSFEDKKAYYILDNVIEEIDMAIGKLKRFSLPAIEGKLQEDPDREKFELIRSDTGKGVGYLFSCGDYLEVYDHESDEWYVGRVEHGDFNGHRGYYFYCNDLKHPFLYTGMRARIRREY